MSRIHAVGLHLSIQTSVEIAQSKNWNGINGRILWWPTEDFSNSLNKQIGRIWDARHMIYATYPCWSPVGDYS